ncbi:MAG TPA: DUF6585 family protein [Crinalium sp.]
MSTNLSNQSEQLGQIIGEFGWNKGRAKALLGVWIFLFIFSLPLSLALIGLPGLILSGYFIYRSFQRIKASKPVILICQNGLLDSRQGRTQTIYYSDIKNLFLSVVVTNGVLNYIVTIELQTGQKIKIDEHVADVDRLRSLLEEQVVKVQLPGAIASYQQGNAIAFGNLVLTQEGLSSGKRTLPWSDFGSADIQRRIKSSVELLVFQKSTNKVWFSAPRSSVPNLALFFTLLNYIGGPSQAKKV